MLNEKVEMQKSPVEVQSSLQYIYDSMELTIPQKEVDVMIYAEISALAESSSNERIGAALKFFMESIILGEMSIEKVDKNLIDRIIAEIDSKISEQLDEILHHPDFQSMESA